MANRFPPKPFRTDGCSFFPDGFWGECCEEHDRPYWRGGTMIERLIADLQLSICIAMKGFDREWYFQLFYCFLAVLMFVGVRFGGTPWLPTPWRWGYGWHYPRYKSPGDGS